MIGNVIESSKKRGRPFFVPSPGTAEAVLSFPKGGCL
jgi:hypothetical protein